MKGARELRPSLGYIGRPWIKTLSSLELAQACNPAFLMEAGRSEAPHYHYPMLHKKTDASLDYIKQNQPTNQTTPRTPKLFPRTFQLSKVPPLLRSKQDVFIQSTLKSSIFHHWRSGLNLTRYLKTQ